MFELSPIKIVISAFRAFWLDPSTAKLIPVVAGGEGPIPEGAGEDLTVPADFEGLDEGDLRELHAKLEARYTAEKEGAKTKAQVDVLRGYREAQSRIVAEINRQATERAEVAEALTTLSDTPPLPAEGDEPKETEGDDPKETEAPAETAPTPEAIAAGLGTAADIAGSRPGQTPTQQAPTPARTRPRAVMTAAASQSVVPYGADVDLEAIGRIADGVKGQLRPTHEAVRAHVASVASFEDAGIPGLEILSTRNSVVRNDELIREAVEAHQARRVAARTGQPVAQTAAICDPLDIIREIPDYVSQADPLAAALPSRPISRLGFTFTPAIALAAGAAGVQAGWNDTNQGDVDPTDPETWKPCYDVVCGSPCEIMANASTACMTFDVTTEMSNPERVRDIMSKLTALRIRTRTENLLDAMDALSIQWTRTGDYSLLPDTIYAVEDALARMAYPERLNDEDYTLFLPPGFSNMLAADIHGQSFLNSEDRNAGAADAVRKLAAILGVDTVQLRDETDALQPALPAIATPTALNDGPCAWPLRLIHTPSALYGSTGLIDTGIQSDPQLARQNKRQWFQEEFSLLTKHGSPPWAKITLTSAASGSRAAASTKLACA